MSRWKMNWDWAGDPTGKNKAVRVIVYTQFVTHNLFNVKIMTGETSTSPKDKPRWTGTYAHCPSHMQAFDLARAYAEKKLIESGEVDSLNPLYQGVFA